MAGISKRVFGADLHPRVRQKLELRQALSEQQNPNESVQINNALFDNEGKPIAGDYKTNFNGLLDLSSRTTIARMWTAVQIHRHTQTDSYQKSEIDEYQALPNEGKDNYVYVTEGSQILEKKIEKYERIIYEVGNHNLSRISKAPNQRIETNSSGLGDATLSEVIPNPGESNDNQFLKPAAGITSVSSNTEGALGVIKKCTVNFTVNNFHDFDNLYSKYFLKPGAQVFVDFGWDTAELYDPAQLIFADQNGGKAIEDLLYGEDGFVTKSNGDMETLLGYVTDYDSKINTNGTVACSLTITSKNNALLDHNYSNDSGFQRKVIDGLDTEAIRFASAHFNNGKGKGIIPPNWNASADNEDAWDVVADRFAASNLSGNIYNNAPDKANVVTGVYWQQHVDDETRADYDDYTEQEIREAAKDQANISNDKNLYISFGFLEDKILNSELGIGKDLDDINNGGDLVARFDTSDVYTRWDPILFERQRASEDATSLSFLYPDEWNHTYSTKRKKSPSGGRNYTNTDKGKKRIPLRELFISTAIIKESFEGADNIKGALKGILDAIRNDSHDIMDLNFFSPDYASSKMTIIDKNHVTQDEADKVDFFKNMFQFKPQSPTTIVNGYDVSFKTPSGQLGNMIAIQSMQPGRTLFPISPDIDQQLSLRVADVQEPYDHTEFGTVYLPEMGNWANERIAKKATTETVQSGNFAAEDEFLSDNSKANDYLDSYAGNVTSTFNSIDGMTDIASAVFNAENPELAVEVEGFEDEEDETEQTEKQERYGNSQMADSVSGYYGLLAKKDFFRDNLPTVLPVELKLSIYGISSLAPGDVFRVDYLPKRYLDLVYFQVMKVDHSVDTGKWTTNLETVMRMRKDKKKASGLFSDVSDIYIAKSAIKQLNLYKWDKLGAKKFQKFKPIMDRPFQPSKLEYIYSCEATEDFTLNVDANWAQSMTNYAVIPTINDPVPRGWSWSGKQYVKDGFSCGFDARLGGFLATKGYVYDFYYKLKVKKGARYKLLTHGFSWVMIPESFGSREIKAFHYLWKSVEEY